MSDMTLIKFDIFELKVDCLKFKAILFIVQIFVLLISIEEFILTRIYLYRNCNFISLQEYFD